MKLGKVDFAFVIPANFRKKSASFQSQPDAIESISQMDFTFAGQSKNHCLIVIPTYNEALNIQRLIEAILRLDDKLDILIVDDNSPDGTAQLVKNIMKDTSRVQILERPGKLGLGTAYIAGFKRALSQDYQYICQMDADFSHQPHYLPILLSIAEYQSEVVIGSRYIRGGGVKDWSLIRQVISRGGSFYTRLVLGVTIRDCTGGFKCFRSYTLRSIDFSQISSSGYGFQVELNYQCFLKKFNISEYPIIFPNRVAGESKMSGNIVKEAALRVLKLRWQQYASASVFSSKGRRFLLRAIR